MQFTFDEIKHELTVEEDGKIRKFILYDNLWEITYLILKAIDKLDNGDGIVVDWARPGSEDKIPNEKLDLGTGPNQIVQLNERGKIPGGLSTLLEDGDKLIIQGGTP